MPVNWVRILNKNLPKAAAKLAAEMVEAKTNKHGILDLMKAGSEFTKRPAIRLKHSAEIIPVRVNQEHWEVAQSVLEERKIIPKRTQQPGWENAGYAEGISKHAERGWLIGDHFVNETVLNKVLKSLYEID